MRFIGTRGRRALIATLSTVAVAAVLSTTAPAKSSYLNTWRGHYPNSQSDDNVINGTGSSCQLCHGQAGNYDSFNGYGWKLRELEKTMSETTTPNIFGTKTSVCS